MGGTGVVLSLENAKRPAPFEIEEASQGVGVGDVQVVPG